MIEASPSVFHISGRCGLGDNIYWRPLVMAASQHGEVFLDTPWPELFNDMIGVRVVQPTRTKLRTQIKNISIHRRRATYHKAPADATKVVLKYDWDELQRSNILAVMESKLPVLPLDPFRFTLPDFGPSPLQRSKPIAVLRPATERREWLNKARNPDPKYLAIATEILKANGYHVVMIADLERLKEWFAPGPRPKVDEAYQRGQLRTDKMLAIVQNAAVVVGPVGWIVPATLAMRVPAVIIGGGQGGHNAPERVVDPRMDASRQRWVLPDPQCNCIDMLHECVKDIPDFEDKFTEALRAVTR